MEKHSLTDKVAIVTGGAGGIGSCIVRAFSQAGAKVVIASRNQENIDALAAEITATGAEALAVATDVCDRDQVKHGRGDGGTVWPC